MKTNEAKLPTLAERRALFAKIKHGSSVTILTPHRQTRSGRAVMIGDYGWVLDMGGAHGTPGMASEANVMSVRAPRDDKAPKFDFRSNPSPVRIVSAYCDRPKCFKIASKVSERTGKTYCASCAPAGAISIADHNHALQLARRNPTSSATRTSRGVCACTRPSTMVDTNGVGWCKTHAPAGSVSFSKARKSPSGDEFERVSLDGNMSPTRGAARENPSQEDKSEVDAESARSMLQNSRIGDVVTYRSAKTGKICRATVCHKYALYGGIRLQVARTVDENKTMRGEAIVDASNIVSTAGLPRRNPSGGAGGARAPGGMSHSLTPGDKRMIEQIVGNFHVGESDEVIEADMRRRLAKGETPKQLVALAVKHAIKTHHKNRDLYRDVMSGRIGRGR